MLHILRDADRPVIVDVVYIEAPAPQTWDLTGWVQSY